MGKLLILRGIPASGKSTFAREWVNEDPSKRIRINRDDIRFQLYGKYVGVDENMVTTIQDAQLRTALKKHDVVLDNTNLARSYVIKTLKIAREMGAEVEFKDFPTTKREAANRDSKRLMNGERNVGQSVVASFYDRYTPNGEFPPIPTLDSEVSMQFKPYLHTEGLPHAILVDIDGTLAHMTGRSPYDPTRYHEDSADFVISGLAQYWSFHEDAKLIIMSGRDETYLDATREWLRRNLGWSDGKTYSALYMRPAGDTRNDAIVKDELFEKHIAGKYNVDFVLDDRDRVVKMWRAKGLKCLQVADGDF